jgi:uncharacterized protein with HEPN domain
MLEAVNRILEYTAKVSEQEFFASQLLQDAVGPEFAAKYPSIPFGQIYGMRNRVAHGYFAVSTAMVWDSVQVDLPDLRQQLVKVLGELESEG